MSKRKIARHVAPTPTTSTAPATAPPAHTRVLLIWVMIYPMMIQIDIGAVRDVGRRPKGLTISLVISFAVRG